LRVTAAALAGDERTLATVEADRGRLWDPLTGEEKGEVRSNTAGAGKGSLFTTAALSPDGRVLAVGRQDGTLLLWNASEPTSPVVLGTHRSAVTALLFTPDGKSLLSGGLDACVRFWDMATRREYAAPDVKAEVRCLALCPGRRVLAVGDVVGLGQLLDM